MKIHKITVIFGILAVLWLTACGKTKLAETVESHREWLTNTEGVADVKGNSGKIIVIAESETYVPYLKMTLPEQINEFEVSVISKETR